MKKSNKIAKGLGTRKIISISIMCFCLLFLTAANFFIYPSTPHVHVSLVNNQDSNDEESPAPVEEKSSSKTGLTIQEEYIHELHSIKDMTAFITREKHKIPSVEKLQIVHFELVSPPPKA
ncbi:MAG: hypothetical protein ABIT58_00555 [Ferruginibacter sp.]